MNGCMKRMDQVIFARRHRPSLTALTTQAGRQPVTARREVAGTIKPIPARAWLCVMGGRKGAGHASNLVHCTREWTPGLTSVKLPISISLSLLPPSLSSHLNSSLRILATNVQHCMACGARVLQSSPGLQGSAVYHPLFLSLLHTTLQHDTAVPFSLLHTRSLSHSLW